MKVLNKKYIFSIITDVDMNNIFVLYFLYVEESEHKFSEIGLILYEDALNFFLLYENDLNLSSTML